MVQLLEMSVADKDSLIEALKLASSVQNQYKGTWSEPWSLAIIVIQEKYTLRCKNRMSVAQNWWIMCIFAKDLRADTDHHCRISEFVA